MATTGRIVGPVVGGLLMQSVAPGAPFLVAGAMMGVGLAVFLAARHLLVVPERQGYPEPESPEVPR
jgi:MFS family permease